MIRVLQVVTHMNRGGLETMLMNYYRHMDRNHVQFDFLTHRPYDGDYGEEIHALGGKIYHLPLLNPFSSVYLSELDLFFKKHPEYSVIHVHQDCMSDVILKAAKKNGVPVRIAHSHNSHQTKDLKYPLKLVHRRNIPHYATDLFACGNKSGDWMFCGAHFRILTNAIDAQEFRFREGFRRQVREELGISEEEILMGHVGSFSPQKNHGYLIDIFNELQKRRPARLLLVGDREDSESVEEKVRESGLSNKVIFTGLRTDVNRLLMAMDVFVMPSLYEGVSFASIEAQASGLPCLISDKTPMECDVTGRVRQIALSDGPAVWAEAAIAEADRVLESKEENARDTYDVICAAGYDINKNAAKLQRYYLRKQEKAERMKLTGAETAKAASSGSAMGTDAPEEASQRFCTGRSSAEESGKNTETDDAERKLLTVFTPTYNRKKTLSDTYASLKAQDCKDFLWLIVDDGSTDGTEETVHEWQKADNGFEIRYIYKENGGMHTAHNTAYEAIDTELNVCIDSDDTMAPGAVSAIKECWESVRDQGYAGIIGLDAYRSSGKIIGKGFPEGLQETKLYEYYANGGAGDKKLVYRTDVVREFPPYPVFPGEKYVGLVYLYRLIDQKYTLAVLNRTLCEVEYLPEGSSRNMYRQYVRNPQGFACWRKVAMLYPESRSRIFVECVHYVSSSLIARNRHFVKESPRKGMTIIAIPAGILLTGYIRIRAGV